MPVRESNIYFDEPKIEAAKFEAQVTFDGRSVCSVLSSGLSLLSNKVMLLDQIEISFVVTCFDF